MFQRRHSLTDGERQWVTKQIRNRSATIGAVEAALKAIADPKRREILRLIWKEERPAGDVAAHFSISRPAVSKHLRVLRESGLVEERREGTRRLYRARQERLAEVRRLLDSYWDNSLAAIKRAAEDDAGRRRA